MTEPRRDVGYWWKAPLILGALIALAVVWPRIAGGGESSAEPTDRPTSGATRAVSQPYRGYVEPPNRPADEAPEPGGGVLVVVVRVVDGDSIHVDRDGRRIKIRIVGLDTPEVGDCWRDESSARAEELLDGETVRIAPDPSQDRVDRYGRELHDVWLADGRLYAEVMVREGHAPAYVYRKAAPNRYAGQIAAAEDAARSTDAGLWSPSTCSGRP